MNGVKFWNTNLKSDSFEDFQLVTILDPSFLRLRFTTNFFVERTREKIFRLLRIVSKTMVESMLSSVSEIPSPDEFVSIPTPPQEDSLPTEITRALRADNRIIAAQAIFLLRGDTLIRSAIFHRPPEFFPLAFFTTTRGLVKTEIGRRWTRSFQQICLPLIGTISKPELSYP